MKPFPILLVEDDENDVFFFRRAAGKAELDGMLHVVRDGDEAIDYLSGAGQFSDRHQHPWPVLIVLDLNLPRRHGFDVLRWRREHLGARPLVVVFTSSSAEEDKRQAYELGANSYLIKPNDPDELVELVQLIKAYWSQANQPPPAKSGSS